MKLSYLYLETAVPTKAPIKAPPKQEPKRSPFNPPRPAKEPGPKAGNDAPVVAPPERKTAPKTTPKRDPFNPPRPAKSPFPKASWLMEAYDDEVHPANRSFWAGIKQKGHKHPYSKHPLMAVHGDELSRKSFDFTSERLSKVGISRGQGMRMLQQSMQIEHQHADQLVPLAKRVIAEIWDIPESMFDAELVPPGQMEMAAKDETEHNPVDPETIRGDINKRITFNAMTHGSSVHNMLTAHHLVRNELNAISPSLVKVYDFMAAEGHKMYWLQNMAELYETAFGQQGLAGLAHVEYEEDTPKIVAKAISFPILIQELNKGVMELLSHHGLAHLDADQLAAMYKESDQLADEQWAIQIGPEIWRRFIKLIPKKRSLSEVVTALSQLGHESFNDFIMKVADNPEDAAVMFADLFYEEPPEYQDDEELEEPGSEDY